MTHSVYCVALLSFSACVMIERLRVKDLSPWSCIVPFFCSSVGPRMVGIVLGKVCGPYEITLLNRQRTTGPNVWPYT